MDQIVAVTHQFGVALLLDHHLQVAVHAALTRGVALARDGEDHTLAHAGRDLDLHDLLPAQRAFALAHDAVITLPVPPHVGHTPCVCIRPKKVFSTRVT